MRGGRPSGLLLPRARSRSGLPLGTPAWGCRGGLGNGTEDNFNLDVVHVLVSKVDDLVKSFLPNVCLGLCKRQILPLDHLAPYRPFTRAVPLDTFFQRNIKEKDHGGNLIALCQFQEIPSMGRRECSRIHHTEAVQTQPQLREVADKSERLGVKTLVALVVAYASSRPVRGDDLRRAEVTLCKG